MFEEVSKEYTKEKAKKLGISDCTLAYYAIQVAHQKGAEFGYNKANEYARTIIQDLLDNSDEYARERATNFLKKE